MDPKAKTMTQRINERMAIETVEAVTDELNEINNMMRNLIADIRSARLSLAELRRARENGENND